jgi:hypothetical protein
MIEAVQGSASGKQRAVSGDGFRQRADTSVNLPFSGCSLSIFTKPRSSCQCITLANVTHCPTARNSLLFLAAFTTPCPLLYRLSPGPMCSRRVDIQLGEWIASRKTFCHHLFPVFAYCADSSQLFSERIPVLKSDLLDAPSH